VLTACSYHGPKFLSPPYEFTVATLGIFPNQKRSMLDSLTVYVLAVVFLATLIRSTLGFGEALVAVPLLALRTPIVVAAPLAVLLSVVVAGIVVIQDWRRIEVRSAAGLILSSLFGIPLGIWLLVRVNGQIVKLVLGVVIVAFSLYSLFFQPKSRLQPAGRW